MSNNISPFLFIGTRGVDWLCALLMARTPFKVQPGPGNFILKYSFSAISAIMSPEQKPDSQPNSLKVAPHEMTAVSVLIAKVYLFFSH